MRQMQEAIDDNSSPLVKVFSYGTIKYKFPMREKVSATLEGKYQLDYSDMFPRIKEYQENNSIPGILLFITPQEFKEIDTYEGYPDLYQRKIVEVILDTGEVVQAWMYF